MEVQQTRRNYKSIFPYLKIVTTGLIVTIVLATVAIFTISAGSINSLLSIGDFFDNTKSFWAGFRWSAIILLIVFWEQTGRALGLNPSRWSDMKDISITGILFIEVFANLGLLNYLVK